MKNRVVIISLTVIINACIWGFAIIMTAYTLKGTGAYEQIQHILGGSAAASLVVVGGGLVGTAKGWRSRD